MVLKNENCSSSKSQAACLSALKILFASEALDGARMLLQAKGQSDEDDYRT